MLTNLFQANLLQLSFIVICSTLNLNPVCDSDFLYFGRHLVLRESYRLYNFQSHVSLSYLDKRAEC